MLLIVERLANVSAGHEHTQFSAILAMIPHGEVKLICAASANRSDPGAILSDRRATKKNPEASLSNDVAALARYCAELDHDRVCIVIPSANAFEIRLALGLLDALRGGALLCLRVLRPEDIGKLTRATLDRLRDAIAARSLTLHTETVELKVYLEEKYNLPADDNFLLPCSIDPQAVRPSRDHRLEESYRVGFLGAPRKDKGARELPYILRSLARTMPRRNRPIIFTMQKPKLTGFKLSSAKYLLSCNLAAGKANNLSIDWHEGGLPEAAFCNLIESQDLLLLPYRPDCYSYRGSGMIVDGILAGLPILHTKGIAMKHLLADTGMAASSMGEFASIILGLSNSPPPPYEEISAARAVLQGELGRTRALFSELVAKANART